MGQPTPGAPSIERPDTYAADDAQEFYCWRDATRLCNAACPAFDPRCLSPEANVNPCAFINNMRSFNLLFVRLVNALGAKPMPSPPTVPLGVKP